MGKHLRMGVGCLWNQSVIRWSVQSVPPFSLWGEEMGQRLNQFSVAKDSIALISHANKVMLKLLQARLQQYVNRELPDVQAGFIKGRGIRDQIANIHWIIEEAREFQKSIYFCFNDYAKTFDCGSQQTVENSSRDENTRSLDLSPEKCIFRSRSNS